MAIIALPYSRLIKKIEWSLDRPAQVNRSAWTGQESVVSAPWHGRWSAKVELLPIVGEAAMLPLRAFLAALKGQINTFRLPMTEGGQTGTVAGAVSSVSATYPAGAGATSLLYAVPGGGTGGLLGGMFVTVNDQPLLLTVTPTLDVLTGTYLMTFEPPLRAAVANGTAIETRNPTCLVALTDSSTGYSVEPGKIYGTALNVAERF